MKNLYEILLAYGLTVPEDKKTEFDKAVNENYKTIVDYDKQATKLTLAEGKVQTTEDALKKFEGIDVTALQGDVATLRADLVKKDTEHAAKLAELEFNALLDGGIAAANGKNNKAIRALLDLEAIGKSKNQSEDISKALKALQEENGYLFDAAEVQPTSPRVVGNTPGTPASVTKDTFNKMGYKERVEIKNTNPGLYDSMKE